MRSVLFLLLAGLAASVSAQDAQPAPQYVEQEPVLIGGMEGLAARVTYPEEAAKDGAEGRVFVQFVVDTLGGVSQAECVRSPHESLCRAAILAVEASQFEPGRRNGEAVAVRFTLPVVFRLPEVPTVPALAPGQSLRPPARPDSVYEQVDVQPELRGGIAGLWSRVEYPEIARRSGVQGRVFVQFVVDEDGKVQDVTVLRDLDAPNVVSGRSRAERALENAAMRAVRQSVFTPGQHEGRAVKVLFTVPIDFKLR